MLSYDYDADKGWHDLKIVPYGPIEISPAAQGVHYGQSVFEGLKAYKRDGKLHFSVLKKILSVLITR